MRAYFPAKGALFAAGVLFGLCCSDHSSSEPTAPVVERSDEAPAEPPADEPARRVSFDLSTHLDRSELRHGDALVIDFGTPAAAQYTLGGWRTRIGDDHRFGEVTTTLIEGVTGQVLLPSDSIAAQHLSIRARAFSDGRLTVYLNGDTLGHARLPTDGSFATVSFAVPSGALVAGENTLQLRVPARGRDDGVRAGIALDWLRLGSADESVSSVPTGLGLPAGWSRSWSFEVPDGATLAGSVSGDVEVVVHRDGEDPRSLGTFREGSSLDAPGEVVRLELRARSASTLSSFKVMEPGEDPTLRAHRAPQNVIVWLVDTVRADKLSPWNPDTRVQTPGLTRWAAGSGVFERGATQENWTKPSVATLLSGLLPWQHTATSGEAVLPRSVDMLSETLREGGFHTGAFVCNGYVSDKFGFRQGWSSWRNYIREGRRTAARFVAGDVLSWLDARPSDKPFFLYVHTIDPHVPYIPPEETLALYDEEPYDGPVDFRRDRELLEKIKAGSLRLGDRDKRRLEALYDGEITYHDAHFAAVMEGLERRGLADSTMVVFTADHGEEFFDHDSVGHGHSLFEELLHVPLLMKIPGLTDAGTRVSEPVGLVDVVPTVLEAIGRPIPRDLPGQSALNLLRGARVDAPRPVIAGFMEGWRSIAVGRYKLIQRTHRRWMLFDLREDPREQHDVAARHPLVVRYLRGLLGLSMNGQARHEAEETEIDPATRAQLEALGYVGGQPR
ncbi:MAG: sulfatase-like hydrolase/transferase [Myxococcota bacterium]